MDTLDALCQKLENPMLELGAHITAANALRLFADALGLLGEN